MGYTAPEIAYPSNLRNEEQFPSDIWSVGCVIFATLAGISPYPAADLLPKPDATADPFPTDWLEFQGVSALGVELIQSLVQVDWKKRPTATMALQHRWLLLV